MERAIAGFMGPANGRRVRTDRLGQNQGSQHPLGRNAGQSLIVPALLKWAHCMRCLYRRSQKTCGQTRQLAPSFVLALVRLYQLACKDRFEGMEGYGGAIGLGSFKVERLAPQRVLPDPPFFRSGSGEAKEWDPLLHRGRERFSR